MTVFFRCKSCESEHRSPAGFADRQSFEASVMSELRFVCRITGASTSYSKADLYWRAEPRTSETAAAPPRTA